MRVATRVRVMRGLRTRVVGRFGTRAVGRFRSRVMSGFRARAVGGLRARAVSGFRARVMSGFRAVRRLRAMSGFRAVRRFSVGGLRTMRRGRDVVGFERRLAATSTHKAFNAGQAGLDIAHLHFKVKNTIGQRGALRGRLMVRGLRTVGRFRSRVVGRLRSKGGSSGRVVSRLRTRAVSRLRAVRGEFRAMSGLRAIG